MYKNYSTTISDFGKSSLYFRVWISDSPRVIPDLIRDLNCPFVPDFIRIFFADIIQIQRAQFVFFLR